MTGFVWKIILFLVEIGIFCFVFFYFGKRALFFEKLCKNTVQGKVVKYTFFNYGGSGNVRWPIVEYSIKEHTYNVIGPKYKGVVTVAKQTPWHEIKTEQDYWISEKGWIHIRVNANSSIRISNNIMEEMYPVGTNVTVYYNPKKPKEAYAGKYYTSKYSFYALLIFVITLILAIILIPLTWIHLYSL